MPMRETVKKGDSLWSLAHRHLGSGTKYQEIVDAHNKEAARFNPHSPLIPITDPNLIFVGQTIIIPSRSKRPQPGFGKKVGYRHEANQAAKDLRAKLDLETANDGKSWHYKTATPDYTIEASMTARVGIENLSKDRYQYSFNLLVSKNKIEIDQRLCNFHSNAFKDLTDGVKMTYESGQVTIKAPIATHANVGPYTFTVRADAPNHFAGSVKFEPLKGIVENKERKFAYTADVEFEVAVTVHPIPKRFPEEAARHRAPDEGHAKEWAMANKINWTKAAKNTGDFLIKLTITLLGTFAYQARLAASIGTTTSTMPMMYRIDLNDPRFGSQNPGVI
jgi:LysM repeat protein